MTLHVSVFKSFPYTYFPLIFLSNPKHTLCLLRVLSFRLYCWYQLSLLVSTYISYFIICSGACICLIIVLYMWSAIHMLNVISRLNCSALLEEWGMTDDIHLYHVPFQLDYMVRWCRRRHIKYCLLTFLFSKVIYCLSSHNLI